MLLPGVTNILRALSVSVLTVVTICLSVNTSYSDAQTDQFPSSEIDRYILQEMANTQLPGIAVVIVQNQEVVYLKGFGYASLTSKEPVTPQTIFDLASCSKSFTALAVLTLWNKGLIELDNPVVNYLPEFQLAEDNTSSSITVQQLLHQTSGLPGEIAEPVSYHRGSNAMKELVAAMSGIRLENTPGESFQYANSNYNLLGALIERVTGQRFEDYIQEEIFTPLGMKNSTLYPEAAARSDRADGHQLFFGRVVTRNTPVYRSAIPAGWVMSSAEDMGKWLIVNLNDGFVNGESLVPAELIETMQTTGITFIEDGEEIGYAMGWFTDRVADNEVIIWHGGDTPNFISEMILLPEKSLGIVMLANGQTCQGGHDIAFGIASLVLDMQFSLPSAPWWASWKSIDNIAIYATVLSLLIILGLIPYIWWQWRVIRQLHRQTKEKAVRSRRIKIWWFVLPITPWMFFIVIMMTAYLVIQLLFGYNVFLTIGRFGYFAPPGVLAAAITMLVAVFLWAITLSVTTIFRAMARESKN